MAATVLTKKVIQFIVDHCKEMPSGKIAEQLGISRSVVQRYMRENKIGPTKEQVIRWRAEATFKPFTAQEDAYIIANIHSKKLKLLAVEMHRTSRYVSNRAKELGFGWLIEQRAADSRIKKGSVSFNKGLKQSEFMTPEAIERTKATRFKNGHLPGNTLTDGAITIRPDSKSKIPYKHIRLSLGKWIPLHQKIWEDAHGKVPAGMCLWFKDRNPMNCALDNLELITRAENIKRNRSAYHELPAEVKTAVQLVNRINKIINGKEHTNRSE